MSTVRNTNSAEAEIAPGSSRLRDIIKSAAEKTIEPELRDKRRTVCVSVEMICK